MNVSRQIGWSNESNLLYQILKQLNRLSSIMFGLKPKYKVFTALLTQSGGAVLGYLEEGVLPNNVTKGVTYQIQSGGSIVDFTNVGAPNNIDGTWFVATNNEVPTYYGTSQLAYNTGAPIVTVLENTIGNIWFTYITNGTSNVNSDALFTDNKTWCSATLSNFNYDATNVILGQIDDSVVQMITLLPGDSRFDNSDTSIEIRVYS